MAFVVALGASGQCRQRPGTALKVTSREPEWRLACAWPRIGGRRPRQCRPCPACRLRSRSRCELCRRHGPLAGVVHRRHPALPKGQVLTARLSGAESKETRDRLLVAIRAFPGVVSAGAASHLPRLDPTATPIVIEPFSGQSQLTGSAPATEVTDGFLDTIGGRPMAGRSFTSADFLTGAAPVAIVNQPFVDRFFNGRSPVGRRLKVSTSGWREIVGMVPDLGMSAWRPWESRWYRCTNARSGAGTAPRDSKRGNPNTIAGPLRRAVAAVDPKADVRSIQLLEGVGREQRSFLSGMASAMTALGVMTLLLSVVSIYALLSFLVTRRTREIGIRVALGARSSQVLTTVAGGAFALLMAGTGTGTIAGVTLAGFQSVLLIRMPDAGVTTPAIVIGALMLASIAAAWIPTRRALGIRPSKRWQANRVRRP